LAIAEFLVNSKISVNVMCCSNMLMCSYIYGERMIKWSDAVGGSYHAPHWLSATLLSVNALWQSYHMTVRHSLETYQYLTIPNLLFSQVNLIFFCDFLCSQGA